jgi:uncharacterized protein (DUF427 family)
MATKMRDLHADTLSSLRYEPTEKRLRVYLADELIADTGDGRLVWEPRRVVPTYAVPAADISARLEPTDDPGGHDTVAERSLLDPSIPFAAHSCAGTSFDVVGGEIRRTGAAFRPDDPDLADYVALDFGAFEWREEEAVIVAHPHDPFRRIDILPSTRHVRIEWEGQLLAESSRPLLLFETLLPVRFYLPRNDIAADLQPNDAVTYCAYKGRASYYSVPGGPTDVAWTYHQPLHDAEPVRDRIAFFDERVDVVVDGQRRDRPVTPWSR